LAVRRLRVLRLCVLGLALWLLRVRRLPGVAALTWIRIHLADLPYLDMPGMRRPNRPPESCFIIFCRSPNCLTS